MHSNAKIEGKEISLCLFVCVEQKKLLKQFSRNNFLIMKPLTSFISPEVSSSSFFLSSLSLSPLLSPFLVFNLIVISFSPVCWNCNQKPQIGKFILSRVFHQKMQFCAKPIFVREIKTHFSNIQINNADIVNFYLSNYCHTIDVLFAMTCIFFQLSFFEGNHFRTMLICNRKKNWSTKIIITHNIFNQQPCSVTHLPLFSVNTP